jgi:zona occludens toxin (predicted ATPase)
LFNKKKDNESDFCESYKSEILGSKPSKKGTSLFSSIIKLLTILILLAIIIGVSFYGYNYFITNQKVNNIPLPPVSMQVSDDELSEKLEESKNEKSIEEINNSLTLVITPENQENDIEKIANDVKIAIAKSELKEENETKRTEEPKEELKKEVESLEIPTSAPEAQYLEELADLSKEIDKERNK